MIAEIQDTFESNRKAPHSLIELSKTEHNRMVDNSIHLSDTKKDNKTGNIYYDTIKYGRNIRLKKTQHSSDNDIFETKELSLSKIKYNTVLITIDKKEATDLHTNLIVTSSRNSKCPSGILVLSTCTFKQKKTDLYENKISHGEWYTYSTLFEQDANIILGNFGVAIMYTC